MCSDCAGAELDGSGECKEGCRAGAALESRHSFPPPHQRWLTTGKAERPPPRERGSKVRIACGDRHARKEIHAHVSRRIVPTGGTIDLLTDRHCCHPIPGTCDRHDADGPELAQCSASGASTE
jgi:hypothetical protein